MSNKSKIFLFWTIAFLITIGAAVYQRMTGPNHPVYDKITMHDTVYKLKFPRSSSLDKICLLEFSIPDTTISGKVFFKRYPTNEPYQEISLERKGDVLQATLPNQPTAGKLAYYVDFTGTASNEILFHENPVIIRFNDAVPAHFMIPHIAFMFFAMLISNLVALLAIRRRPEFRKYLFWAFGLVTVGGMILGPIVQKYAFGEYWTGIPNGWDLTDNKTLIAWVAYLIAVILNLKKENRRAAIIATVVLFMIYLIPHSMFGSELDPTTGEIIQG
jgi:hypothetical protein